MEEIPSSSVCSVLRPRLFPGPASTAVAGGNGASCGGKVVGGLVGGRCLSPNILGGLASLVEC